MLKDSELTYVNENGKPVHGAAAYLHRVFGKQSKSYEDKLADLAECRRIILECGYGGFGWDDD
jgi:hypothetical protein